MTRAEVVEALVRQMLTDAGLRPRPFLEEIAANLIRPLARDFVASGVRYLLVQKDTAIFCLKCGMVSHNPNDVDQRYCGNCHEFLEAS